MKTNKNFLKKLTAGILGFVMTLGVGAAGYSASAAETKAAAAVNTVLWGENFAHFGTKTPSAAGTGSGTTIYGGASISYAQSSSNTKGYNETSAGGTAPELLLSKSNHTWTISGINTGYAEEMSLTFLSNKTSFSLTCSSDAYTIGGSQKSWTLTLGSGKTAPETIDLTLKNTASKDNARIDNVELKVKKAGTGGEPEKEYTSLSITGSPTKTNYFAGESFDPTGLVVTGYYSSGSETITSGIDWLFDPSTLRTGITSVDVMASLGSVTSDVYTVNGITVVNAPQKFSHTFNYGEMGTGDGKTWSVTNAGDQSTWLLVPSSGTYSVATFPTIFKDKIITSDIVITINHATYGSGSNASSNTFAIYSDSSCSSCVTSTSSGTFASSSTYVDGVYTITKANASSFGNDLFIKVTKPGKQIRLKTIKVEFEYQEKPQHNITISGGASSVYEGKNTPAFSASCNQTGCSNVTWSVVNGTGSASITQAGVLTGISAGTVTVKAKCAGGGEATKSLTVLADSLTLKSISVTGGTRTFEKDSEFNIDGLVVNGVYSHANGDVDETIALGSNDYTVSPTVGTKLTDVTSSKTVTVTAKEGTNINTTYTIAVNYAAVSSLTLSYTSSEIGKNDSATLPTVTISPENADQNYDWGAAQVSKDADSDDIVYTFVNNVLTISSTNTGSGTISFTATSTADLTKSATVTYTIKATQVAKITGVNVKAGSGTIVSSQVEGTTFDPSGLAFEPIWSEGEHEEVQITASDISWNTLVKNTAVTGTYSCGDGDFTVTVPTTLVTVIPDALDTIEFDTGDMTNKTYIIGLSWNFAGLKIKGTMLSGSSATIDQSQVVYSADKTTTQLGAGTGKSISVTATYGGKTTTTPKVVTGITIQARAVSSILLDYSSVSRSYTLGDEFSYEGLKVDALYNDGSKEEDVTGYTVSEPDMYTVNSAEQVTVSYGGQSASFTIDVHVKQDVASSYTLVEDISTLKAGDEIILAATYSKDDVTTTYVMSGLAVKEETETEITYDKYATVVEGSVSEKTISPVSPNTDFDDEVFIIGGTSGSFTLTNSVGQLGCTAAKAMAYGTDISATTWTFGSEASGEEFSINANEPSSTSTDYGRILFNYNNGKPRFLNYSSDTSATMIMPSVYKKTVTGSYDCIALSATQPTRDLYAGDNVTVADFSPISALFNDGKNAKTVTENDGVTISSGNPLVQGDNTITLSYKGINCNITLHDIPAQTKVVDTITMGVEEGKTAQTAYYLVEGETPAWNFNNIVITISYSSSHEDETLTIAEAMNNYGAVVSPSVPTKNVDGFTVTMSVLGVSLTNGHFSASVTEKAIDGISSFNFNKDDLVLNYFEGEVYDTTGINSVTLHYNSGDTLNINKANFETYGVKIGLVEKTTDNTLAVEINGSTALDAQYDGYYLATQYGSYVKPTTNKIRIAALLNEVSYVNPDGTAIWKEVNEEEDLKVGEIYTFGCYNKDTVATAMGENTYFAKGTASINESGVLTPDSGITPVQLTLGGSEGAWTFTDSNGVLGATNEKKIAYNSGTTTWTISFDNYGNATIQSTKSTYGKMQYNASSPRFTTYTSSQTEIQLYHYQLPKTVYSNLNKDAQHAVVDYAKWFVANVTADATDAKWNQAISKYAELVTDVVSGDDLTNAENLVKYATAKADGDVLQQCVAIYDAYIAKYNLTEDAKNFFDRDVEPIDYTVTLIDSITEEEIGTITVNYGDKYADVIKTEPEKDGYEFKGWYTSKTGSTEAITHNKTEGATIYAQWTKETYTITLNSGDCDTEGSLSVTTYEISGRTQLIEITAPVKEGYTPAYTVSGGSAVLDNGKIKIPANTSGNITVTTTWNPIQLDVTFDSKGGSSVPGTQVIYDETYGELPVPKKNGYDFVGWYTKDGSEDDDWGSKIESTTKVTIVENQTLYAKWTLHTYNITFNKGDGATGGSLSANTYQMSDGSQIITITDPTKTGMTPSYTVSGGGATIDGNTITIPANTFGDIAITTTWTGNPYVISFDGNGGSTPSNVNVEYGKAIESLPESTLEHYTFLGWFTEKVGGTQVKAGDVYNIEGNTTLYAHWEANKHTVVINGKEQKVNYDNQIVLDNEPAEVKEGGYFFNGWVCDADNQLYEGGATYTMPDKDVSFSAQWIKTIDNTITVTTQANFTYKYTVAGGFQEVTGYSLRMYVSLDEVSYQYYVEHGYTFTINFINNGNGQVQILRNVPVWYDAANDCYVFDIGVKIPATKLDTSLGVELVATPSSGDACTSNTVEVTYMEAAQALYNDYDAGTVELNEEQADALKSILGIKDAE